MLAEEEAEERHAAELQRKRKRERAEDKDRLEDMVGPKEIGKAGMLEKKRVKRENDKGFRERGDDGFVEADDKTLMGGGDSFKERCVTSIPFSVFSPSIGSRFRSCHKTCAKRSMTEQPFIFSP